MIYSLHNILHNNLYTHYLKIILILKYDVIICDCFEKELIKLIFLKLFIMYLSTKYKCIKLVIIIVENLQQN